MVTITHDHPREVRHGDSAPSPVRTFDPEPLGEDVIQSLYKPKQDAGEKAANLLRTRMKKVARTALIRTWMVFSLILTIAVAALAGAGYYFWQHRVVTPVTYERACRWQINDKLEVTGRRTYTFQQNELFGIRWNDAKGVLEKTSVDVIGKQMLVVGLTADDKWWGYPISTGERGIQNLKPADSYVFVIEGDKVGAVKYNEFCK